MSHLGMCTLRCLIICFLKHMLFKTSFLIKDNSSFLDFFCFELLLIWQLLQNSRCSQVYNLIYHFLIILCDTIKHNTINSFFDWLNQTLPYCCATLRSISFRIQQTFEILFFIFKYVFYVSKSHACFGSEWYNSLGRLQLYLIWLNDYFQVFIFEHTHFYTYLFFSLQRLRVTQPHHFRQKNVEKTSKLIGWYLIRSEESSTLNWLICIIWSY